MSLMCRCRCCLKKNVPWKERDLKYCNDCRKVRVENPVLFDFFIEIIERHVEAGVSAHSDLEHPNDGIH